MTSYRKIGEIIVTLALAFLVIKAAQELVVMIFYKFAFTSVDSALRWILPFCMYLVFMLLLVWGVKKRGKISGLLFKDDSEVDISGLNFEQALRLVFLGAGVFMIGGVVSQIASTIFLSQVYMETGRSLTAMIVSLIIKAMIAFELLRGAPWFVRWQVKQMKRMDDKYVA